MSTGRTAERSAAAPTERSERRREGTGGQFGREVTILDTGAAGVVGAANWTERTIVAPTPLLCRAGGSAGRFVRRSWRRTIRPARPPRGNAVFSRTRFQGLDAPENENSPLLHLEWGME